MKIDLHIHTKKILQDEPSTRNVDNKTFIKTLKSSDVGIAAITNHNVFDLSQYESFKSNDFLLLPGCEIDIKVRDRRRHINVITSPKNANSFSSIIKEIKNTYSNPIELNDFIKIFDKNEYILYPDFKGSGTSFDKKDLEFLYKISKKAVVLVDTNNAKTLMVLKAHNFNSLIGSDIRDWSDYLTKSEKLLDTKLHISSFEILTSILKYDTSSNNDIFRNISSKKIDSFVMKNTNYEIKNLEIKTGINIIFGAKRTGKTEIIREIGRQVKEKSAIYFSSNGVDANLEQLSKRYRKPIQKFEKYKNEYRGLLNSISTFEEKPFNDFHKFYKSENLNKSKILFCKKWNVISIDPRVNSANKINKLEEISVGIKRLLDILRETKLDDGNFTSWKVTFDEILDVTMNEYREIFLNYWKRKINFEIKEAIRKISEKFNGTTLKPSSIGLITRYEEKRKYLNNLNKVISFEKKYEENIKELYIPKRGTIYAKQCLHFLEFSKAENVQYTSAENNKVKTTLIAINKILKSINYITNFSELAKKINEMLEKKECFFESIKFIDKKNISNFSNGEISHMTLFEVLDEDKEYYLLDEPGVYLGTESISLSLLERLGELVKANKTIVITTHNSSIGINSIPINYIFRKYENENDECQTYIGSIWKNEFTNLKYNFKKIDFINEIINNFEGGEKHFSFRKEVYDGRS